MLLEKGYRVVAIIPPGDGVEALQEMGLEVELLPMNPRGVSPLADGILLSRYIQILRRLQPAAFLGFTAKPNIYGGIAARMLAIPAINNITGLGTSFLSGRLLEGVVANLYKAGLRNSAAAFFHNSDDLELFVTRRLVTRAQAQVIPGSGIDLARFAPAPWPDGAMTFLFVGRLLIDKGILELGEAAQIVKSAVPGCRFIAVGEWSPHPRAAPRAQLDRWVEAGVLELVGNVADVRPFIERAHVVVLPSYREGLPRALLEASAMARPSIAADVPGSRDVVEDKVTGFLCEPRSARSLAAALLKMAELPDAERRAMGERARRRTEDRFGEERVGTAYLRELDRICR
ncbi:MAG: glycosyltransferase family 4 protein [Pseudomonadota bacterium]|nr:glycosyltransferase family 4 protein [Pseudomonadota bacterium]